MAGGVSTGGYVFEPVTNHRRKVRRPMQLNPTQRPRILRQNLLWRVTEWRLTLLSAQVEAVRNFLVPSIVTELGDPAKSKNATFVVRVLKS